MSFLRNITIVYSNKGRGMDTLARHYLTSSCICRANARTHLEYTPWHDTKIQGIYEFFTQHHHRLFQKGRGMDTLARHYLTSSCICRANARTHLLYTPWHDTKYKVLMSFICRANAQTHLEYTPWHDGGGYI
jgi:hypothetical protein